MSKNPESYKEFEILDGPITLEGKCWKGFSACFRDIVTGDICVITAPDRKFLRKVFKEATGNDLDGQMLITTVGDYGKVARPEAVWIFDRKRDKCMIQHAQEVYPKNIDFLGNAERKTAIECKILLRKLGWDKEDINDTAIDMIDWTDDIPF